MKETLTGLLLLCSLVGCSESPEPADTPPAAAPPSVRVVSDREQVAVAPSGVRVTDSDRDVQVGPEGVRVRHADGREVRVGAAGIAVREAAAPAPDAIDRLLDQAPALAGAGAPAALTCDGSQTVIRNGVSLDGGDGPAISASGSCDVICNDCRVTSRRVAVAASGSANVILNDCTVQAPLAISASGSSDVRSSGSTIRGRTARSGNADIRID